MSGKNVDIVREAYEAVNRGDLDTAVSCIASDMEYVARGIFMGPEGVKEFIAGLYGEFDEPRADVSELLDAGDQVLVSATARGRGKLSGVETTWDTWQLWTLRSGKLVRGQGFTSREAAVEAAGLPFRSCGYSIP